MKDKEDISGLRPCKGVVVKKGAYGEAVSECPGRCYCARYAQHVVGSVLPDVGRPWKVNQCLKFVRLKAPLEMRAY